MEPRPQFRSPVTGALQPQTQYQLSQQQTLPQPIVTMPLIPAPITPGSPNETQNDSPVARSISKKQLTRTFAIFLTLVLGIAIFLIWQTPSSVSTAPGLAQQASNGAISNTNGGNANATPDSGDIQVYVTGAVKHPGVYTLPSDARIFQLVQAAGGALPDANLVALNLAAKLTDGEEVYVLTVGEIPPSYVGGVPQPGTNGTPASGTGQLVNINTASTDDLRTNLHVSSTTAQNIVNYRLQHGPYTSIDQLLQVISKAIYDRIKTMVTI
ncbi:MAG TPA: ComEA family DNA-binding protein [Ktedonobacteraceae bacterium]|nr:ComEA family DNA-binding protein [Ktedonobacteraceae bacterium]